MEIYKCTPVKYYAKDFKRQARQLQQPYINQTRVAVTVKRRLFGVAATPEVPLTVLFISTRRVYQGQITPLLSGQEYIRWGNILKYIDVRTWL